MNPSKQTTHQTEWMEPCFADNSIDSGFHRGKGPYHVKETNATPVDLQPFCATLYFLFLWDKCKIVMVSSFNHVNDHD